MRTTRLAATAVTVAAAGLLAAPPASAAPSYAPNPAGLGRAPQTLSCDGQQLTIVAPGTPNDTQAWSVGQIVQGGSGHLIPTSFTFSNYLVENSDGSGAKVTIFSGATSKGGGHANGHQTTVTCTGGEVFPETLAQAVQDPSSGITGVPDDILSQYGTYYPAFELTVTAIPKP